MGSTTKPLSAASPGNAEAAGPIFRSREQDHALPYLHLLPRHNEHLGRPDSRPAKRGSQASGRGALCRMSWSFLKAVIWHWRVRTVCSGASAEAAERSTFDRAMAYVR